jgi:hypothetical protein
VPSPHQSKGAVPERFELIGAPGANHLSPLGMFRLPSNGTVFVRLSDFEQRIKDLERERDEWKARYRREKKLRKKAQGAKRHWKHNHAQQVRRVRQIARELARTQDWLTTLRHTTVARLCQERDQANTRAELAEAALARRDEQVRKALEKLFELRDWCRRASEVRDDDDPGTRAEAYKIVAGTSFWDQADALRDLLTQPSSTPPRQDREDGRYSRSDMQEAVDVIDSVFKYLEESGLAETSIKLWEATKPLAQVRVRLAEALLPQPQADPEVPRCERSEVLESALRTIRGPEDRGPWMEFYREAGGGYSGLQAIAEAALSQPEAVPGCRGCEVEIGQKHRPDCTVKPRLILVRDLDCQPTPELPGEEITAEDCDEAARALFQYATKSGRSHERSVELLAVAQKFVAAAVHLTQPVSESPGNSGEGVVGLSDGGDLVYGTVKDLRELAEDDRFLTSLQAHLEGGGSGPDRTPPAGSDVAELERTLDTFFRFAAESGALTQSVPGNSGGEEEGEIKRLREVDLAVLAVKVGRIAAPVFEARGWEYRRGNEAGEVPGEPELAAKVLRLLTEAKENQSSTISSGRFEVSVYVQDGEEIAEAWLLAADSQEAAASPQPSSPQAEHLVPVVRAEPGPGGDRCWVELECGHSVAVPPTFNAADELELPTALPCSRCLTSTDRQLSELLEAVKPFTVDGGVGCGTEEVDALVEAYERIIGERGSSSPQAEVQDCETCGGCGDAPGAFADDTSGGTILCPDCNGTGKQPPAEPDCDDLCTCGHERFHHDDGREMGSGSTCKGWRNGRPCTCQQFEMVDDEEVVEQPPAKPQGDAAEELAKQLAFGDWDEAAPEVKEQWLRLTRRYVAGITPLILSGVRERLAHPAAAAAYIAALEKLGLVVHHSTRATMVGLAAAADAAFPSTDSEGRS